jgi:hypothetical protein
MDFGNLGGLGASAAGFIATPEGQTAVKNFLATPDGMALLKNFASSSQGQQVIMSLLPSIVDGMNLPEPVKAMIKSAAPATQ